MKKASLVSIALICLVAFSVIYGLTAITVCHADNGLPYSVGPVAPLDNGLPYSVGPIVEPQDNGLPY